MVTERLSSYLLESLGFSVSSMLLSVAFVLNTTVSKVSGATPFKLPCGSKTVLPKVLSGSSQPKSLVVQYSSCQYLPTPGFADKAGLRKDNHPASGALAKVVHPPAFSTVTPRTSRKLLPRPKSGWGDERRVAHSRTYHSRGLRHQHVTANVRNLCWKN